MIDGACDEAFESADGFAEGFAFTFAAVDIVAGGRQGAVLGERDAVDDGVELAIGAAVEAVSELASRRGLERGDAGIGGKAGFRVEAMAGTEVSGEHASSQRGDATDISKRGIIRHRELLNLEGESVELFESELETACERADSIGADEQQGRAVERRLVGKECCQSALGSKRRQESAVCGVKLEKMGMNLITETSGLGQGGIAFRDKDVQDGSVVIGVKTGKIGGVPKDDEGDRACIQDVGLVLAPSATTLAGGPAGIDVINTNVAAEEELGKSTTIATGPLNADLAGTRKSKQPIVEVQPACKRIIALPDGQLVSGLIKGMGNVNGFVCVDANGDQEKLPLIE